MKAGIIVRSVTRKLLAQWRSKSSVSEGPSAHDVERFRRKLIGQRRPTDLGQGRDVRTATVDEWPTAYALIASEQLIRYQSFGDQAALGAVESMAEWLIKNVGCASTRAPIWGVPYPRAIWNDPRPAQPGTGFTVPTSHALQALSEVVACPEVDSRLRAEARSAVRQAVEYYSSKCFDSCDGGIVFWYSALQQHSYHVNNASAIMAGEIQRAAQLCEASAGASEQSDRAVRVLLEAQLSNRDRPEGMYLGQKQPTGKKNRPNDLFHASLICHGLLDYKEYSGSYGATYSYLDLYRILARFIEGDRVYEYCQDGVAASRRGKPARLLGVGHALYVASRLEERMRTQRKSRISRVLFAILKNEYFDGEHICHRPGGDQATDHVRDVAHVLLGLAQFRRRIGH